MSAPPRLRIEIDRQACIGAQNCVRWAPGVFEIDAEGIAVVRNPAGGTEEQIRQAERDCPTGAIFVSREPE
jgi:ferredoxin